jgi:uncharacterized damage-inducible protein DinB
MEVPVFRRVKDFADEWAVERESTLTLLRQLTDGSLDQAVIPGGRTLGFLAWHIAGTFREMLGRTGLQPDGPDVGDPVPARAADIVAAYDHASRSALEQVTARWTDDMLEEERDMYGERWRLGAVLDALIRHEAHHRGQMTVLMRQAGLPVAGPYGPSREEWVAYGMEPHP